VLVCKSIILLSVYIISSFDSSVMEGYGENTINLSLVGHDIPVHTCTVLSSSFSALMLYFISS